MFIQIISSISTIQFSMSTQFNRQTFLFQAIQFIQTVLIQPIQFSISIDFVYPVNCQNNFKKFSLALVQFQCQK